MIPANDSKLWPIITLVVVGVIFSVNANVLYQNGWSNADFLNLIMLVLGVGGVSLTQMYGSRK
jgi:hypothetical protein